MQPAVRQAPRTLRRIRHQSDRPAPGQPMTMYHRERYQEGFLVLRGECLLIVEGQEMQLRQSDYFHCPPDVAHAIVGAGARPSLVLAVGNRLGPDVSVYPRDETALKHEAGVEQDTPHPKRPTRASQTRARRSIPGGVLDRLARRARSGTTSRLRIAGRWPAWPESAWHRRLESSVHAGDPRV